MGRQGPMSQARKRPGTASLRGSLGRSKRPRLSRACAVKLDRSAHILLAGRLVPRVLLALVLAFGSACTAGGGPEPRPLAGARLPPGLRVKLTGRSAVRRVPLEDYVRGALLSELVPDTSDPALAARILEVQAIIVRTYAVAHLARHGREGYDLCSSTHCQLYDPTRLKTSRWARAAGDASRRTAGVVLWYGSRPASTLYHADCGGYTSTADDVWGGAAAPYLVAASDDGPAEEVHTTWRFEVERSALLSALNADSRTRVGSQLSAIRISKRDKAGRAALVVLHGTRDSFVRGEELRAVLTRAFGTKSIRSTKFDIHRIGSRFAFAGKGFGHGVGLCQAGALARLRAGTEPHEVLMKYYPGTIVVSTK